MWFWGLLAASILCGVGGIVAALMLANGVSRRAAALSRNADRTRAWTAAGAAAGRRG
jgi:hypothetical protein